MAQITQLTAQQLAQALQARELSAAEVTAAHLDHIRAHNEDIHAFLTVSETATDAAKDIDRRRDAGETLPELAGVPIAVKDMLVTTDMPTTGASRILEGYQSPFDATVVTKA